MFFHSESNELRGGSMNSSSSSSRTLRKLPGSSISSGSSSSRTLSKLPGGSISSGGSCRRSLSSSRRPLGSRCGPSWTFMNCARRCVRCDRRARRCTSCARRCASWWRRTSNSNASELIHSFHIIVSILINGGYTVDSLAAQSCLLTGIHTATHPFLSR